MSTLDNAKMSSLKDKLSAQDEIAKVNLEEDVVEVIEKPKKVRKGKGRKD